MRARLLALTATAACAVDATAERRAAIVGGVDDDHAAVVALEGASGPCSGVVLAPRVVATAGHCAGGLAAAMFGAGSPWDERIAIVAVRRVRTAVDGLGADLALARLARPTAVAPLVRGTPPPASGAALTAIGFGRTEPEMPATAGRRRATRLTLAAVEPTTLTTDGVGPGYTCAGDSGGAGLDDAGAVIGLVVAGAPTCDGPTTLVRLDVHAAWIDAVLAAWDGPCAVDGGCVAGCATLDPDCDPCGLDGTCQEACAAPDLDCPLGGGPGASCQDDLGCESRRCVAAPDDPEVRFCSAACDGDGTTCPAPLAACADGVCAYAGPTPGAFGASCATDAACRSGWCDRALARCTRPCRDGCPDGYACGGDPDEPVCRPVTSGCTTGAGGDGATALAVLFALAGVAAVSGRPASAAPGPRPARPPGARPRRGPHRRGPRRRSGSAGGASGHPGRRRPRRSPRR